MENVQNCARSFMGNAWAAQHFQPMQLDKRDQSKQVNWPSRFTYRAEYGFS